VRRHEIDHRRRAGLGPEFGFKDPRAGTIAPARGELWIFWSNEPTPILSFTEQGGKARSRIETRPAQPIDRAVAADKSRRLAVAYQRVVFDAQRHCYSSAETSPLFTTVHRGIEDNATGVGFRTKL
jgi:hypothetical protein